MSLVRTLVIAMRQVDQDPQRQYSKAPSLMDKHLLKGLLATKHVALSRPALSGGMNWWRMLWPLPRVLKLGVKSLCLNCETKTFLLGQF